MSLQKRCSVALQPALCRGHKHHSDGHPGVYSERDAPLYFHEGRDWSSRAFTVGIGGPVGSGKTALTKQLCLALRDRMSIAVVTNDIFTREDAEASGDCCLRHCLHRILDFDHPCDGRLPDVSSK